MRVRSRASGSPGREMRMGPENISPAREVNNTRRMLGMSNRSMIRIIFNRSYFPEEYMLTLKSLCC